jgi:hypothetical protein
MKWRFLGPGLARQLDLVKAACSTLFRIAACEYIIAKYHAAI